MIHPGEFCLGRTLEWVELPDDIVARIEGKALAIDTPVPTADGWRTMAEVEPGDWVFDLRGRPTPVLAASETMLDRPCRAVEFSDGTTVVADVDHQWQVWSGDRLRVVTTRAIERALDSGTRHFVPPAGPLRAALPVMAGVVGENFRLAKEISQSASPKDVAGALPAREITDVRRCESVPVRCIQVGSPDGVFLVSRSFIPTHNSSLGRLGLIVHATAGFCDPGWKGTLTLELNNLTRVPIKLYPVCRSRSSRS